MKILKRNKNISHKVAIFVAAFSAALLMVLPMVTSAASTGVVGDYCDAPGQCLPVNHCDVPNLVCAGGPEDTTSAGSNTTGDTANTSNNSTVSCGAGTTSQNGLCIPNSPFGNTSSIAGSSTITDLATKILKALLFLSGIISVIVIIVGGFWYITSAGNAEQAEKGQRALTNAIIGLVVVILAYAIVTII